MGGNNSAQDRQRSQQKSRIKNPEFQSTQVTTNLEGKKCFVVSIDSNHERTIGFIKRQIVKAMQNFHKNILQVIEYSEQVSDGLNCGMVESVNITYEHLPKTLQMEMLIRYSQRNEFSEEMLWDILKQLSQAGNFLHCKNISHGDIRAHNIFIGKKSKGEVYKLFDLTIIGKENQQFKLFQKDKEKLCTLSPEEFSCIKKRKTNYDQKKADVFQAGMCLLQAATLKSCPQVYNWKSKLIHQFQIDKYLQAIKKQYSKKFVVLLRQMLEIDPLKRVSFDQVLRKCGITPQYVPRLTRLTTKKAESVSGFRTPKRTSKKPVNSRFSKNQEKVSQYGSVLNTSAYNYLSVGQGQKSASTKKYQNNYKVVSPTKSVKSDYQNGRKSQQFDLVKQLQHTKKYNYKNTMSKSTRSNKKRKTNIKKQPNYKVKLGGSNIQKQKKRGYYQSQKNSSRSAKRTNSLTSRTTFDFGNPNIQIVNQPSPSRPKILKKFQQRNNSKNRIKTYSHQGTSSPRKKHITGNVVTNARKSPSLALHTARTNNSLNVNKVQSSYLTQPVTYNQYLTPKKQIKQVNYFMTLSPQKVPIQNIGNDSHKTISELPMHNQLPIFQQFKLAPQQQKDQKNLVVNVIKQQQQQQYKRNVASNLVLPNNLYTRTTPQPYYRRQFIF